MFSSYCIRFIHFLPRFSTAVMMPVKGFICSNGIYVLLLAGLAVCTAASCQPIQQEPVQGDLSIIPLPASLIPRQGFFLIDHNTWIQSDSFPSPSFDPLKIFQEVFQRKSGYTIPHPERTTRKADSKHLILIIRSPVLDHPEAYRISIKPFGMIISAYTEQGLFYAFQTLRQMMRLDAVPDAEGIQRQWAVPAVEILDQPGFTYRGLHLDVCRHFMPVSFVKKYIDLLAFYKMNRFHWHLTEDQGWRIEIKKYPKLQEIAAWRDETLVGHYREEPDRYDGTRHGGYYTQEEIRDVVAYAADRGVTIIPEIEMPGHSRAALAAYPHLACTPGPITVATTWGVFEDVFCPKEETFTFLQDVLDEVMDLFPSPYIHIGGDECPKTRWKESAFCQDLMKKEGLKNEEELQSYFIGRIEKYLNSKGRNIIGWDEILEGGLAPNATVMSWRGVKGGIEAAKAGHDVIMTPGTHCYFDHYQADPRHEPLAIGGLTTLEKVYTFNPVPVTLSAEEAKHIQGAQGNLWTEYISTPEQVEYMVFPRALALAEVLWTPSSNRNWQDFVKRLNQHTDRLDGLDVNYAKHLKDPSVTIRSGRDGLELIWTTDLPGQTIFFTRDTSSQIWLAAMSGDTTLFRVPGPVFYKSDHSAIHQISYWPSKARNATLSASPSPENSYPGRQGIATLADGLKGTGSHNGQDWCAWKGSHFSIDIDFLKVTDVDSIHLGVLSSPGSWIHAPVSVEIKGSTDHQHYQTLASRDLQKRFSGRQDIVLTFPGIQVLYLRINILPVLSIPAGKPGAGQAAWTFIDEISVY